MRAGSRLGRYILTRKLGQGGMAEVWEALDEQLQRNVAAKIILPAIASEREFGERFVREARVAASLEHPHIVSIYDFGAEGETAFLVTPLLPGGSLRDRLREAVPIPMVLEWLTAIGAALDFAHRSGILHRDVTPANILFDKNGRALLSDFGLAKSAGGGMDLTMTGAVVGTPAFMSPEQGLGRQLDARSDQFSLGVIAYRALTGRLPFSGDTAVAVLHQTIFEQPPPPSTVVSSLPADVDEVIGRVLSKDPAGRFESCIAFVDALKLAVGSSPTAPTFKIPPLPEGARTGRSGVTPSGFPPAPSGATPAPSGSTPTSRPTRPTAMGLGTQPTVRMPETPQVSSVPSRTLQTQTAVTKLLSGDPKTVRVAVMLAGAALLVAAVVGVVLLSRRSAIVSTLTIEPTPLPRLAPSGEPPPPSTASLPADTATSTTFGLDTGFEPEPTQPPSIIERWETPTPAFRRPVGVTPTAASLPSIPTTHAGPPSDEPGSRPRLPATATVAPQGPPPGPPADVRLEVRKGVKTDVSPEEARVFLDGRYIGTADDWDGRGGGAELIFEKEGRHRLRLALAGKRDLLVDVIVSASAESDVSDVDASLESGTPGGPTGPEGQPKSPKYRTSGPVRFKVQPPEAEVSVDGRKLGPASRWASDDLVLDGPAVHEVSLSAPGYLPLSLRVLVGPETEERAVIDDKLKAMKR